MKRETEYFNALLRCGIDSPTGTSVPPPGLDWEAFRRLIRIQVPLPLIMRVLLTADGIPDSLRTSITGVTKSARRRSGFLTLELLRLIPALEEAGCKPTVLKGPALAQTVYNSPEDRYFTDLDILIPVDSWVTALKVLAKFGYSNAETRRHPSYYEHHHFHKALLNNTGIRVELHWDLSKPADYYRFNLDDLIDTASSIEVNGVSLRIPSDNTQLLHAALQALSEGYADLRRVVDATLLIRNGSIDYDLLAQSAREQGGQHALWTLFMLLESLCGLDFPMQLMNEIQPSWFPRHCLRSLGLTEKILTRSSSHRSGLRALIYWLCCPDPKITSSKLFSYIFPDEVRLLELGYSPDSMPSTIQLLKISVIRSWSLIKLSLYQGWRLLAHGTGS